MTTNKLQLTVNIIFLIYCIALITAISSVNTDLKYLVDNRSRNYTTLEVKQSYPSQSSLKVAPTKHVKGLQVTADQWTAQKALNHDGDKLVQQSKHNRWSKIQYPRNNYSEPVQKTAQAYQYQLNDMELVQ